MSQIKAQTPKGFRDFLPSDAIRRKAVLDKITKVFEKFGFDPLETPSLEYEETLQGKYGEEEKLIYKFETPGGDKVALKYDQTVPLARVIAQYGPNGAQKLPMPFKRYQVQSAFRGENTQKGRYREFLQCDADIVGLSSPLADAELLALCFEIYKSLGLNIDIKINDRSLISDIEPKYLAAIDKLNKIGEDGVLKEMEQKGLNIDEARSTLQKVRGLKPSQNLEEIMRLFQEMGYPEDALQFDQTLIRGLDYYTGLILEVVLKDSPNTSSLCGGGRYDKLIGKFTGMELGATGFAIGFDRTVEAMIGAGLLTESQTNSRVLVTIFSKELQEKSLNITLRLRSGNISTELWLDPEAKLEKQLKYADQKGIPYVVIIGPDEAEQNNVTLKNLAEKSQQKLSIDELVNKLSSST
jgi:histidyl-tRNA synthetase